MRLTVLRACRQMYAEANEILWTTNTFSFTDGITLKRFLMTRNIHQKRLIRSLRFEVKWNIHLPGTKEWNHALSMPIVKSLSELRNLRLQILYDVPQGLCERMWQNAEPFLENTRFTEGLRRLSTLPLVSAAIVFMNTGSQSEDGPWTSNDRKRTAKNLRAILLNPKGAVVYSGSQRGIREGWKKQRAREAERKAELERFRRMPTQLLQNASQPES